MNLPAVDAFGRKALTLAIGWRWMPAIQNRARAVRPKTLSPRPSIAIPHGWSRGLLPYSVGKIRRLVMDAYRQRSKRRFRRNISPQRGGSPFRPRQDMG